VNYALDAAFLLDLDGDDEAFAADGDEFVLHGAAFGEAAEISAEGILDGAALSFDFAADAGEFGRGVIFECAVGLNFVAEEAEEVVEVSDLGGECADGAPLALHAGGGMEGDFAPFRGAIDDEDYVANLGGFEDGALNAGFRDELGGGEQAGKFEASADAAEFADFAGELVLGFDPVAIGGGSESGDAGLTQGRGSVSAQEVEEGIELEDASGTVG
jgi:hypothetical protein